jgi:hypothetical protein
MATEFLETVVVEIPVVPEDTEVLTGLLPDLGDIGVRCVNLHQMWCSPSNAAELIRRGYTFLHGSRVTVLESELAALEVLEHAVLSGARIPVHYCSSVYKHRFQTAAALGRDARLVARDCEEITAAGLIRALSISGSQQELEKQRRRFEAAGASATDYCFDEAQLRLSFKASLWDALDLETFTPRLTYDLVHRLAAEELSGAAVEIPIAADRYLRLKRSPVEIVPAMSKAEQSAFRRRVVSGDASSGANDAGETTASNRFDAYETIEAGLPRYF